MKKVLAICLTVLMLFSMSVTAFAAPNGFVSSPSGNRGPDIVTVVPDHEDCTAELIVTPYPDRNNLPDDLRTLFEKAYDQIIKITDLTKLVPALASLAESLGIKGSDLTISDFFTIHATGCDSHQDYIDFDVTLSADSLKNFVGLLYMNKDGKWELVKDAQVVNNGTHLQFTLNSYAPFAVVVDGSAGSLVAPQTGYTVACICAIVMVASAAVLCVVLMKRKKAEA